MSIRTAAIVGLLMLAMIAGGRLLFGDQPTLAASNARPTRASDRDGRPVRAFTVSDIRDNFGNDLARLVIYLRANKELFLYGAVGVVGMIIVVLIIGNTSPAPKDANNAIVAALRHDKERAEHLAQLKSEFLNQVSHELRTPLAVIIGYVECMTDGLYGEVAPKHQEILEIVAKQSTHLKNMIDQILIYSRLESNKQKIRIEQISLGKLVGDLTETFDFLCRQKALELSLRVGEKLPVMESDPERLKEILSNLLQNAVKYTDKGSISLRVEHLATADSLLFEISDTGLGIPPHYLDTIFEPFIQVHKTSTGASRGGIGLGLSIVKKHVEQLKGNITVESELANGSTFRIVLPRVFEKRQLCKNRLLAFITARFIRSQKQRNLELAVRKPGTQHIGKVTQEL